MLFKTDTIYWFIAQHYGRVRSQISKAHVCNRLLTHLCSALGATHIKGNLGEPKRHYFVPHHLIFPPINFLYSHMIIDIPVLWLVSLFVRTDRERICSELVSYEAGSLVCTQTARPCCEIGKII